MKSLELTDEEIEWLKDVSTEALSFAEKDLGSFQTGLPSIEIEKGNWEINMKMLRNLKNKLHETT